MGPQLVVLSKTEVKISTVLGCTWAPEPNGKDLSPKDRLSKIHRSIGSKFKLKKAKNN